MARSATRPPIYRTLGAQPLGKAEAHIWEVGAVLLEMREVDATGKIFINYSRGHIDGVHKQVDVLAYQSRRKTTTLSAKEAEE
jgi:hypothetical protein